jgi:hypothetical protein
MHGRRLFVAAEKVAAGYGGTAAVTWGTGVSALHGFCQLSFGRCTVAEPRWEEKDRCTQRYSPRRTLFRIPPRNRALMTWSSASLIVPFETAILPKNSASTLPTGFAYHESATLCSIPIRNQGDDHLLFRDVLALRFRLPDGQGFSERNSNETANFWTGSISRYVCNVPSWRLRTCRPTTLTERRRRRRSPPSSSVCTGAFGTARRRTPSAASSGSARSCMSSKGSTARARAACRHASCGTRCMRSISISVGQAAWLVNYAKRYRAGERVGTSITEGTANFRRLNKSQQMRWSRKFR